MLYSIYQDNLYNHPGKDDVIIKKISKKSKVFFVGILLLSGGFSGILSYMLGYYNGYMEEL